MFEKLEAMLKRFNELTEQIADPEIVKKREQILFRLLVPATLFIISCTRY